MIAAHSNEINALFGCYLASDFIRFPEMVGVSIGAGAGLKLVLQSAQVPLEVRRLPSDAHWKFAKDRFTYFGRAKKWISVVSFEGLYPHAVVVDRRRGVIIDSFGPRVLCLSPKMLSLCGGGRKGLHMRCLHVPRSVWVTLDNS